MPSVRSISVLVLALAALLIPVTARAQDPTGTNGAAAGTNGAAAGTNGAAAGANGAAGTNGAAAGVGDAPTLSFEAAPACQTLVAAMQPARERSADLEPILVEAPADTNVFLSGLFDGTHIMLEFGQMMFEATSQHENACKEALREANSGGEIIHVYEQVLTPTLRGHAFLERVREAAQSLGDEDTVRDMESALAGYVESLNKLVSACQGDLPEGSEACEALRSEIESRTGAP